MVTCYIGVVTGGSYLLVKKSLGTLILLELHAVMHQNALIEQSHPGWWFFLVETHHELSAILLTSLISLVPQNYSLCCGSYHSYLLPEAWPGVFLAFF